MESGRASQVLHNLPTYEASAGETRAGKDMARQMPKTNYQVGDMS